MKENMNGRRLPKKLKDFLFSKSNANFRTIPKNNPIKIKSNENWEVKSNKKIKLPNIDNKKETLFVNCQRILNNKSSSTRLFSSLELFIFVKPIVTTLHTD